MANTLTKAARHAKAELHVAGIEVAHAKLQEVLAALLGYHTYRALKHEEHDQELEHHLSDAEFIVLNQELGECRAAELFELPGEVLPKCIAALEQCLPTQVLPSVDAYLERHGMNAVIAALTNNPQKGVHLGPDWSSRYKLSPDQRFSFHEPIWEARRSWQVHAEVSLQSIAPDAEFQEINVLLTHGKAGRSGLLLRGVKPVKGSRTAIQCTRMDVQVQRDDGSVVRPWAVAVLDIPSGISIGSAVSLDDTPDSQAVNALTDALDSTALRDNEGASENEAYGIIQLDIGDSFNSERFKKIASEAGIEIIHYYNRTNPMRGQIEALFHKISRSIGMKQPNPHRLKPNSDSERMTIEDLKQLFKKS
jgi:transposase InsO family protein